MIQMFIRFNGNTSAVLLSSDLIGAVSPYQNVFDESDVPTEPEDNYFHTEKRVSCRKDKYRSTYEKATQDERGRPMWENATAITEAEYLAEYTIYREEELIPAARASWEDENGWKRSILNLKNDVIFYVRDDFDDICAAVSSCRVTA